MSQDDVRLSPELIAQLNKLATYLTAQGEYEAVDLIDTVVARVSAMLGRELRYMDEGEQAIMSAALRKSAKVVRRNEPGRELLAEALDARLAALEEAAVIAETWFDHHRPQQPKKSRFDIYDIEHWAKSATRLVAEDIRARAAADKIRASLTQEKQT